MNEVNGLLKFYMLLDYSIETPLTRLPANSKYSNYKNINTIANFNTNI
jgi:hypothetical protein